MLLLPRSVRGSRLHRSQKPASSRSAPGVRAQFLQLRQAVEAQRLELPCQFQGSRVLSFQPTERRWLTVFTEFKTRRQVRLYGPSALATCLRRDWARLSSGTRPRLGGASRRCTWITMIFPEMFEEFCRIEQEKEGGGNPREPTRPSQESASSTNLTLCTRSGLALNRPSTPTSVSRPSLRTGHVVWVGPTPDELDAAAERLGVPLRLGNWRSVLAEARRSPKGTLSACTPSDASSCDSAHF